MARPPIVTKGFAKWSLNPDDNATADERINWQEGQMPSSVNNSARAMMMRGREEHDLIQAQFKAIADTVAGRFGNQVKYLIADTYKITQDTTAGHYIITFQFDDKLTADEYQLYIDRKLYLLTRLVASDIVNDSIYKTWGYNTIISINMAFKVGSNLYTHPMEFYLDFFGIEKYNTVISFHELKHYVNNTMLNRFNGAMVSNLIALPMTRTYVGSKPIVPLGDVPAGGVYTREWYYISPTQCIFIDDVYYGGKNRFTVFTIPKLTAKAELLNLSNTSGPISVSYTPVGTATPFSVTYTIWDWYINDHNEQWTYLSGRFTYLITSTPSELTDYPMILTPTVTNPYPIIV